MAEQETETKTKTRTRTRAGTQPGSVGGEAEERRRLRLLEAISGLSGRKRPLQERREAASSVSEFSVSAEGEADRVRLSDLIRTGTDGGAAPAQTRRQLQNLQRGVGTVDSPLSARDSERIQRGVAFQRAAEHVTRWSGVIARNRRSEQLVFPLDRESSGPLAVERVVAGWKVRTPLEQEVFSLLTANQQPTLDPVLTPTEEASVRAVSLEEARIRRAELQKNRVLQSYYEAQARRQRRVKSKQFRRVRNRAERNRVLKHFEELVQTDPDAALEQLKDLERARIQERMSLKHQNSGRWARSRAIVAKYDLQARRAMQDQLEVHKDLTRKVGAAGEEQGEEPEPEAEVDPEVLPDFVNEAEPGLDPSNPWMIGGLREEPREGEEQKVDGEVMAENGEEPEEQQEEEEEEEEAALLREFDSRRKRRYNEEAELADVEEAELADVEEADPADVEEGEGSMAVKDSGVTAAKEEELQKTTELGLGESVFRIKTLEDVELLPLEPVTMDTVEEPPQNPSPSENLPSGKKKKKKRRGIELKQVLTKDAMAVSIPLAPTVTEDDGEAEDVTDQRTLIQEAFAGDDVVSDFLRDKRKQEEASAPKVVDLTLPGWGEWGGGGLQPSRRKRRRFRVKSTPPPPRKDQHLPGVIISEQRSAAVGLHRVETLPFPFDSPAQFETTIRLPLGRTWNTERTVRKLTRPRVLTRLGTIIQPMAEEELTKEARGAVPVASKSKR